MPEPRVFPPTLSRLLNPRPGVSLGTGAQAGRWVDVLLLNNLTPKNYTIPASASWLRLSPNVYGVVFGNVNGPAQVPNADILDGSGSFPIFDITIVSVPFDRTITQCNFVAAITQPPPEQVILLIEAFL
jgi:hypothetical protein